MLCAARSLPAESADVLSSGSAGRAMSKATRSLLSKGIRAARQELWSPDEQGDALDGVAAVAEAVPAWPLGLRASGEIGRAGP